MFGACFPTLTVLVEIHGSLQLVDSYPTRLKLGAQGLEALAYR